MDPPYRQTLSKFRHIREQAVHAELAGCAQLDILSELSLASLGSCHEPVPSRKSLDELNSRHRRSDSIRARSACSAIFTASLPSSSRNGGSCISATFRTVSA